MNKRLYSASYVIVFNSRLKARPYQLGMSLPIYATVLYNRKRYEFPSRFFEQFSPRSFSYLQIGLDDVEEMEGKVIEFVINKNAEHFNIEIFRKEYILYSTDLLSKLGSEFKEWISGKLAADGYDGLARLCLNEDVSSIQLMDELNLVLKPTVMAEIKAQAAKTAPPLIPMIQFLRYEIKAELMCLPLFEWISGDLRGQFTSFLRASMTEYDLHRVQQYLDQLIDRLRVQIR